MLSDKNYNELLKFRNTLVPYDRKLNEREQILLDGGYIRIVYRQKTEHGEGYTVTKDLPFLTTTAAGEDALEEFEKASQDMSKQQSKEKKDKSFQLGNTVLRAFIGFALSLLCAEFRSHPCVRFRGYFRSRRNGQIMFQDFLSVLFIELVLC